MSHIVEIATEVRDVGAIQAACERRKVGPAVLGRHRLFSEQVEGWGVRLRGWKYPVVCDTTSGRVRFDNYEGRWGERVELDRFLQAYAVERARIEARRQGHGVSEQTLADGSIKLTIHVGDDA